MHRLRWVYYAPLFAAEVIAAWFACIRQEMRR